MSEQSKKYLLLFSSLFLVMVGLVVVVFLAGQRTKLPSRAAQVRTVSVEKSYLFATPLLAQGNGREKIRVNVFVLDSLGVGVPDKRVVIGQSQNLTVDSIMPTTDSVGQASFDISSSVAVDYQVQASVEGISIPKTIRVTFR